MDVGIGDNKGGLRKGKRKGKRKGVGKQRGAAPEAEPGPWAAVEEFWVPEGDWAPLAEPGDRAEPSGPWDAALGDWVAAEEAPAGLTGQGQGWWPTFVLANRGIDSIQAQYSPSDVLEVGPLAGPGIEGLMIFNSRKSHS